jgi:hypothetical protein
MKAPGRQAVARAVLKGIRIARRKYYWLTGDTDLWWAPEYLISVEAAMEVGRLTSKAATVYLTLEHGVRDAMTEARVLSGGSANAIKASGRSDILLFWAKGKPRALIEIKNGKSMVADKVWIKDVRKLGAALRKARRSSVEFGALGFYWCSSHKASRGRKSVEKMFDTRERKAKAELPSFEVKLIRDEIHVDRKNAARDRPLFWTGGVFLLTKRARVADVT